MKEGYILKSTESLDYSLPYKSIAEEQIKRFLLHLKNHYDYDEVILYTYNYIDDQTDISIIDNAVDFIFSARKLLSELCAKEQFKLSLFKSSKSIQLVKLTRSYSRHIEHHYLFISTYFDEDSFKITIPAEFNYCNLLQVNPIALKSSESSLPLSHHYPYYPTYENSHHYYDFKEKNDLGYFESIFEINVAFDNIPPILKIVAKKDIETFTITRKAQILIKYYPTDLKYYSTFNMDMTLLKGKEVIKHIIKENVLNYDVKDKIDEFIFPLAESIESLQELDLSPQLTAEFMSQDFEPYRLLIKMRDI